MIKKSLESKACCDTEQGVFIVFPRGVSCHFFLDVPSLVCRWRYQPDPLPIRAPTLNRASWLYCQSSRCKLAFDVAFFSLGELADESPSWPKPTSGGGLVLPPLWIIPKHLRFYHHCESFLSIEDHWRSLKAIEDSIKGPCSKTQDISLFHEKVSISADFSSGLGALEAILLRWLGGHRLGGGYWRMAWR